MGGGFSQRVNRMGREADHLASIWAEVKNNLSRMFENFVLRKTFGPKTDEVTGQWRGLHKKELYKVHSTPNMIRMIKSRRITWEGHVIRVGRTEVAYRVLLGVTWKKEKTRKTWRRWEDDIKNESSRSGMENSWINLVQDRDRWRAPVNAVMNLWVPHNAGNSLTSWGSVSFSRVALLLA